MVVIHTVLFKYRKELSSEKLEEVSKEFNRLIRIPGVDNVQFGPTFTDRGKGYTHMLIVEVADRAVLNIYSRLYQSIQIIRTT